MKINHDLRVATYKHCWPNWRHKRLTVLKHWKFCDAVHSPESTKIKAKSSITSGMNWKVMKIHSKFSIIIVCCSLLKIKQMPIELNNCSMKWSKLTSNQMCELNNVQKNVSFVMKMWKKRFAQFSIFFLQRLSYQFLLEAYCKSGDIDKAIEVLGLMDQENLYINERSFNNLVQCHIICG